MKTLLTKEEGIALLRAKNPVLRDQIVAKSYSYSIMGDYREDKNGTQVPRFIRMTNPSQDVIQNTGMGSQKFLSIVPKLASATKRAGKRTVRNNVPFTLFSNVYRDLFSEFVEDFKAGKFADPVDMEVRDATTGKMVKHPVWTQTEDVIWGHAGVFATPTYWIPKPGGKITDKWIISARNPLTGKFEKREATDSYLRVFVPEDYCNIPADFVGNEFMRRVAPHIVADRITTLKIAGIEVGKEVETTLNQPEQEQPQNTETETLDENDI